MNNQTSISLRKRIIGWVIIGYAFSAILAAPYLAHQSKIGTENVKSITFGEIVPSTQALIWPTYVWQRLSSPPFEDPLHSKAVAELKKFNLIWYYLAAVNRSLAYHEQHYDNPYKFLVDCKGFDDYITALHRMIYASHSLDIHVLNGIYPELGTRFQNSWRKGASLMLNACIDGSVEKYARSKAASDDWFAWYEANSTDIEKALRTVSN